MDLYSFSDIQALSSNYDNDPDIIVKQDFVPTQDEFDLFQTDAYENINDIKINNYSALFLTNRFLLNDLLGLEERDDGLKEIITTFIAADAVGGISSTTRFWGVQEEVPTTTAVFSVSTEAINLVNGNYFSIEILDARYCRVRHQDAQETRYLNWDNTQFQFVTGQEIDTFTVVPTAQDIFFYVLDRDENLISFIKDNGSSTTMLSFSADQLVMKPIGPTGAETLFGNKEKFAIRNFNVIPEFNINTNWVSYENRRDFVIDVNPNKSRRNLPNNYLINTEYSTITGDTMNINILNLKNQITSDKNYSRGNIFTEESEVEFRQYLNMFTGAHQELGDDNIHLNYNFYTTDIIFEADAATKFTTPESIYPYDRLNIKDAPMAKIGALQGSTPFSSDRIFKERSNYNKDKATMTDEENGVYLCSWYRKVENTNNGQWLDRYFNPEKITATNALSSKFDGIIESDTTGFAQLRYFDKVSDVTFEPDVRYIYEHIGNEYVKTYLNTLNDELLISALPNFRQSNLADIPTNPNGDEAVYNLNNDSFSVISDITDDIREGLNNTTISFTINTDNYQQRFGHQIVGNYKNEGFGLINEKKVTPIILLHSGKKVEGYNSAFQKIEEFTFTNNVVEILRRDHLDNFAVVLDNGHIVQANRNGTIFSSEEDFAGTLSSGVRSSYVKDDVAHILLADGLSDLQYKFLTNTAVLCTEAGNPKDSIFNFQNGQGTILFPVTASTRPQFKTSEKDNVLYINENRTIKEWNIERLSTIGTSYSSVTNISDFVIDDDNNVYILHDSNKLSKYNEDRELQYTTTTSTSAVTSTNLNIDLVAEFNANGYEVYPMVVSYIPASGNRIQLTSFENVSGTVTNSTTTLLSANSAYNFNATNYNFLRETYIDDPEYSFTARMIVPNRFNRFELAKFDVVVDIGDLEPGLHHFAFKLQFNTNNRPGDTISRFDGVLSAFQVIIDGTPTGQVVPDHNKYVFNEFLTQPITIGCTPFYNNVPLFEHLGQNNHYFVDNMDIRQFRIYNRALDGIDIEFLQKNTLIIRDIIYPLPSGQGNYFDEIVRYFKQKVPGRKDEHINIIIKNSEIDDDNFRALLAERIRNEVNNIIPANVKIKDITFRS